MAIKSGINPTNRPPSLNVEVNWDEIEKRYQEEKRNDKLNFLIYGRTGTGKSHLISTCPKPVLVHSFDPGGTKTLNRFKDKELIKDGFRHIEYFLDTRFEKDDANKPTAYKLWEQEVNRLYEKGMFNNIGTYVIDSGTNWLKAQMSEILRQEKRPGEPTQIQDWGTQLGFAVQALNAMCNLPCNFVLIGHIMVKEDKVDGRNHSYLFTQGEKIKTLIPLNFDEVYILDAKECSKTTDPEGVQRELIVKITGKHDARSRMQMKEGRMAPDLRAILKAGGYPYEDKPLPKVKLS